MKRFIGCLSNGYLLPTPLVKWAICKSNMGVRLITGVKSSHSIDILEYHFDQTTKSKILNKKYACSVQG